MCKKRTIIGNKRNEELNKLISYVESEKTRDYINTRILPQMSYFSSTSQKHQNRYKCLMTITIISSALIPVVTFAAEQFAWGRYAVSGLACIVTGVNAWLTMDHTRELWLANREKRERFMSELFCYVYAIDRYSSIQSQEERDKIFKKRCEDMLKQDINDWVVLIKSED